uniref:Uncharacterized protein n=1 Tax=viral metagenome TaxID=1070528 RepID=A0A6C0H9B3_9ZZZZ
MRYISNIISLFVKNEKKVLGRWNIDYCNQKVNSKIDLSNEDHCGPCGQYILNKTLNKDCIKNENHPSENFEVKNSK